MSAQERPAYARGGDPRRRHAIRERLYIRRRNARVFDAAACRYGRGIAPGEVSGSYEGDWWADIGMTLGVAERQAAGAVHPWRWAA